MSYEFQITRRVEFSETDMAGIMHFSNYFRFMETAEHAFFRSLGSRSRTPASGWKSVCRVSTPNVTMPLRCASRTKCRSGCWSSEKAAAA